MRHVENVDIRVEFDPDVLPAAVWWAVWDGFEGSIADRHKVELDEQRSAQRYLRVAERTVVGFHWDWLPPQREHGQVIGLIRVVRAGQLPAGGLGKRRELGR
jgi:hypothetical protein